MKCKNYSKAKGKRCCKHFLGHKIIEVNDRVTGKEKYEILESCKCRCTLKGGGIDG